MIEQLPTEDAYPNARNAVAVWGAPVAEEYWALIRHRSSIQDVIEAMYVAAKIEDVEWAEEVMTDDFRRYCAAKLGMM